LGPNQFLDLIMIADEEENQFSISSPFERPAQEFGKIAPRPDCAGIVFFRPLPGRLHRCV
jgi:hypothetical protein